MNFFIFLFFLFFNWLSLQCDSDKMKLFNLACVAFIATMMIGGGF